jgi:DNA uptake protein ComE-like DNA-binding protein
MKFGSIIKDYFTFNRMEQRGLFVLLTILFILIVANEVVPFVVKPKPVDMSGMEKEIAAFERSVRLADSLENMAGNSRYKKYHLSSAGLGNDSSSRYKPYPKDDFRIELNSADTFALQRLRGIGPSFARRIVKYRERLGGYIDKSQLLEIWGMDTVKYNSIKEHLVVNPDSVHPLNLNTVTFKQLLAHPYFPYVITRAIMIYRKDHKMFKSVEELRNISIISESVLNKIRAYLKVGK